MTKHKTNPNSVSPNAEPSSFASISPGTPHDRLRNGSASAIKRCIRCCNAWMSHCARVVGTWAATLATGDNPDMTNPATVSDTMRQYGPTRKEQLQFANLLVGDIHSLYPERDVPHPHVPTRAAVIELLKAGVDPHDLLRAARNYAAHCEKEETPPKYRIGSTRFYRDGIWHKFNVLTVYGRTRDEWARSGQDVAEFDRLAGVA